MSTPRYLLGLVTLCAPMLLSGCAVKAADSTRQYPSGTGFSRHTFELHGHSETVWVFLPRDYTPRERWPAVLFLHGLFEAGHDGKSCLNGGLAPVIAEHPDQWKFVTVFPQSDGTWRGPQRDKLAMAALDWAERQYSVDADRVILAGLSYGGLGTWEIGARHHGRFAALVPVSGHRADDYVKDLLYLPIWAFAFAEDPWVNPQCAKTMCRAIDAHGGMARLTEFAGKGHDGWEQAVNHSELVQWMLKQRRARGTVTVASAN